MSLYLEYQEKVETEVKMCENLYPGIDLWWDRKVIPDIKSQDRLLIKHPEGFAVLKHGTVISKLCHMQVFRGKRYNGLGQEILDLVFRSTKSPLLLATYPEEVKKEVEGLFLKNGFEIITARDIYRLGMLEYVVMKKMEKSK